MAYIGNQPFTTAFLTDQFSGNGTTTAFTLSAAPANTNSLLVAVTGVLQDPSTYSVSGTTLTFSAAPPSGTGNISVRFLGIPASGVVTTAYRTLTEFTATAGQTTFTPPSYTVGYINVFRNGVMLGTADYTASNGTTVVLVNPASAGDLVAVESFYVSSVLNALPTSGGTLSGPLIATDLSYTGTLTGGTGVVNLGSGQFYKNASGNFGVGTTNPVEKLQIESGALAFSGSAVFNGSGEGIYHFGGNSLGFVTGGSNRMILDTSGNVLVGRTNNPGGLSNSLYVTGAYSNTTPSGANVFVNTDGSFYRSTSSLKYKTDVQDYSRGLPDVGKLRPVFYKAKAGLNTEQQFAGFIAEEVHDAGMTEFVQYAEDGTPDALSYGNMVALLTKAVQELTAKLSAAEARIAALENKA